MARGGKCPKGVLCLTPGIVFFFLLVLMVIAGAFIMVKDAMRTKTVIRRVHMPSAVQQPQPQPIHINIDGISKGDDRYSMAPQPYKSWLAEPEYPTRGSIANIPIGIHTRGLPEKFRSVGLITTPDGQVLPLYGRRTAVSSDRWNYYTRTDTYNPVPLPLKMNRRDCMDDTGCNEVMDGDNIESGIGTSGKVTLYNNDGPKYIPGLV
jgi:hypothetical protein